MRKTYLSHDELLTKVENFMETTYIRKYCTNVCMGDCCHNCYTTNNVACHKKEKRRLACSVFLCFDIKKRIFNKKQKNDWYQFETMVMENIRSARKGNLNGSPYFQPLPKYVVKAFKIRVTVWAVLIASMNIEQIKRRVNELIIRKRQVHRL
jgi:hypothetical protein